jgi:hypothetical protein
MPEGPPKEEMGEGSEGWSDFYGSVRPRHVESEDVRNALWATDEFESDEVRVCVCVGGGGVAGLSCVFVGGGVHVCVITAAKGPVYMPAAAAVMTSAAGLLWCFAVMVCRVVPLLLLLSLACHQVISCLLLQCLCVPLCCCSCCCCCFTGQH